MAENIEKQTGNIDDILKIMNRANETFAYEIYVPSLKKNVPFREISTSQQKRLLKAVIDSPVYNTEFIFILHQIIKENCIESLDIDNLTIFDKLIIALLLRSISISNNLDLEFTVPNTDKKIVRRLLVKDIAELAIKEVQIDPITIKDDTETYEILCDLPTILDEYNLEMQLRKNVESIEIKSEQQLRDTVGEVFTNEIVKYIKQVNIKNKTDGKLYEFNLKSMLFKDRLAILGKIPAKINNKIIEYINTVKLQFDKVLLFKETIEGQTIEQRLKIDAGFFTAS